VNIICRLLAVQVFSYREKRRHQLIHLVGTHSQSARTKDRKLDKQEKEEDGSKDWYSNLTDTPHHTKFKRNTNTNNDNDNQSPKNNIEMTGLRKTEVVELEKAIRNDDDDDDEEVRTETITPTGG